MNVGGADVLLIRTFPLAGEGFHLVAERGAVPVLEEAILSRGSRTVRAGDDCLDLLRIEAGLPAPRRIELEAGATLFVATR